MEGEPLLTNVRVLENGHVITGPFAGQMLADLGADVIKVEGPKGDQFRLWEGTPTSPIPATFAAYNRGKRSIVIDLKTSYGVEIFKRIAARSDVVIENSRPGVMERLGVGYWDLRQVNERIIYCHMSGMGSSGPQSKQPTFDAIAQAASGLWSQLTDMAEPEPVGPPLADQLTAMFSVIGVLAALQYRDRTGKGLFLETSMLASCLGFQPHSVAAYRWTGVVPERLSRARVSQSYAFVAGDGRPLAIHLSTPQKFWEGLCRGIGRTDLIGDERFATKDGRIANYDELRWELQQVFAERSRSAWLETLAAEDVPVAPILNLEEAIASEQVKVSGIIEESAETKDKCTHDSDTSGLVKLPVAINSEFQVAKTGPPRLSEHADEILSELGLTSEEIQRLRSNAVIG